MSKTILAEVDGFTPVIDAVVKEMGLMSAVVFGRVWRYCQMEDKVCTASQEKIGESIGVDRLTVMRHIKELCIHGYLEDRTPELRNRPHVYADTGKAGLKLSLLGVSESNTKKGVSQSNSTVSQNSSTVKKSNSAVSQSNLKKELKKESKKEFKKETTTTTTTTTTAASQSVLLAYKSCIGELTPMMHRVLAEAEAVYPFEWVIEALQIAAKNNVKKWSYAEKILKRWRDEGKTEKRANGKEKITWLEIVDSEESSEINGDELKAKIKDMMEKANAKERARKLAGVQA